MSRHELKPLEGHRAITRVVIGWDRPLRTFFAQIFERSDDPDEDDVATLWEGTDLEEIASAAQALAIVAPFAVVPNGLEALLEGEKRDSYDRRDGPEQMRAKRLLR